MENMKCKMMNRKDTVAFFKNAKNMLSDFDFYENEYHKKINYQNKFDSCGNQMPIFIATERSKDDWEVLYDSFYFADSNDVFANKD
jgi:hypothetical protein